MQRSKIFVTTTKRLRGVAAAVLVFSSVVAIGPAMAADDITMALITKTNENPVFVLMREAAIKKAKELGVKLITFAGKYDGDNASQVDALENALSAGAKAVVIVPNDTAALVPQVKAARAAGVVVMVADSPLVPADAADGTYATNNFEAASLVGRWVRATLGPKADKARIAMLDADTLMVTNDVKRDTGFLTGFGIDVPDKKVWGSEKDPRIVGHDVTQGSATGGQRALENLLQRDPDINVVYTMNEASASGAVQVLKNTDPSNRPMLVSIDGTCAGLQLVKDGVISATAMQFWLDMATDGMEAALRQIKTGEKVVNTPGLDYVDSGTKLVTDHPVAGVPSITSDEAFKLRGDMCSKKT